MSLPLPNLTPQGRSALTALLHKTVADGTAPALFFAATNARETIYEEQVGPRVFGDEKEGSVGLDTTLQLYSMTKFIVSIAALQLVEQGKAGLDDESLIETHLPEIGKTQILTGYEGDEPIFVPQKSKVTLRMLLSHSSGFGFSLIQPELQKWMAKNKLPSMLSKDAGPGSLMEPMIYQPGTKWCYSNSIDWAALLIYRLTSLPLEEYLKTYVFSKIPGGMPDTSFYPRQDIKDRMMSVCVRTPTGFSALPELVLPLPGGMFQREQDPEKMSKYHSGSGGLYGTTRDYLCLCRAVLACDPRNPDPPAEPLVSRETYALLFKGSLPPDGPGHTAHQDLATWAAMISHVKPPPKAEDVDHSVALAITTVDGMNGRKKGSGYWGGMAKTQFWIDPESGLAGVCNTQILSIGEDPWHAVCPAFERALYDGLA